MALFASSLRLSFVGLGAMAAVLPLCSGACGRTACFEYSPSEYAATNGCPPQGAALPNFTSPTCPGSVVSVDGPGTFVDNELCCYSVTQRDVDLNGLGNGCVGFAGSSSIGGSAGFGGSTVHGVGGFSTTSTGFAGFGGGTGGIGGTGGMPPCVSCADELAMEGADPSQLCPSAAISWDDLTTCACNGGPCGASCDMSFCSGLPPDNGCTQCFADGSTSGCGTAVTECENN